MKRCTFFLLIMIPFSLFSLELSGRKYYSGLKVLEFNDDSEIKLYEVWEDGNFYIPTSEIAEIHTFEREEE